MERKPLGNTGLLVTPVGMGVLTVGRTQLDLSIAEGARLVRAALEAGINFLDTAEYYETYPYIAAAFREMNACGGAAADAARDAVVCSKSLAAGYKSMARAIEDCRRALDRDVIDIFLLHEIRQSPDFESRAGAWEALLEAKAKGFVRAAGLSTHHTDVAERAALTPEADVLFALTNFKSLGVRTGAGPGSKEEMAAAIRRCAAAGKGVFIMKALGGGNLADDYTEALDYATALPGVTSVMIGMGGMQDIEDAVRYFEGALPQDYRPDVSAKRMYVDQGDCEGCGTCLPRCASGAIRLNAEGLAEIDQTLCVRCGYCAYACPVRAIIFL